MKLKANPSKIIDLRDVSVYELLQMIERGEKDAYYMLIFLKAAEKRMIQDNQAKKS